MVRLGLPLFHNNNIRDYPDYNNKRNNWKFHSTIPKPKNNYMHLKNSSCKHVRKKCNQSGAQHHYFLIFFLIKISYLALEH